MSLRRDRSKHRNSCVQEQGKRVARIQSYKRRTGGVYRFVYKKLKVGIIIRNTDLSHFCVWIQTFGRCTLIYVFSFFFCIHILTLLIDLDLKLGIKQKLNIVLVGVALKIPMQKSFLEFYIHTQTFRHDVVCCLKWMAPDRRWL